MALISVYLYHGYGQHQGRSKLTQAGICKFENAMVIPVSGAGLLTVTAEVSSVHLGEPFTPGLESNFLLTGRT